MSGKYDNYFNELRKIDDKVDKQLGGNNDQRERLYRNYIRTHPNFLHLDNHTNKNKSNQINNIAGAVEMLNTPQPLPINHYSAKKVNYDTTGVHTTGYKTLHYDIEENEVVHKPNPSVKPHSKNNLPHKEEDKKHKDMDKKVKKMKDTEDQLLQKLVNQGLAVVHYKKDKPKKQKPLIEGELTASEVYKMSPMDRMKYGKKMATEYRDKGIKGGFRLPPNPNKPPINTVKPTPKPTPPPPTNIVKNPAPPQSQQPVMGADGVMRFPNVGFSGGTATI